jgi:predicted MPP superfamily phosphohydrolase
VNPWSNELLLAAVVVLMAGATLFVVERLTTHGPLASWSVAVGCCVLGITTVVATALGLVRGLDLFGVLHLWYLVLVVALPLTGLGLLVLARRREGTTATVVLAALMLVPAPIGVYSTHIEPFRLELDEQRVAVASTRSGSATVRVGVLADLQTAGVGDHERRAVQELLDARPDVIVLPGDLFHGGDAELEREAPGLRRLLARLSAPGGVYFVEGDVDGHGRPEAILPDSIRRLDDEVVQVQVADRTLRIGGTNLDYASTGAERVRRELLEPGDDITLLVSHRPDTVLELPDDSGVDLVVAGHTHGGQVALPVFGPPLTLSAVPRQVGAGGLHEVHGNPIYVSTGVGMERGQAPQLRFGVRPSVAVLELGA